MTKKNAFAEDLIGFIQASPTAFHAVRECAARLEKAGFSELDSASAWKLKKGGKHFVRQNDSALLAFVVGRGNPAESGFRIVGTHTDTPCFRVKPQPEMTSEDAYVKLNTEVYGGPILNTWMDRPLSLAGRVVLSGKALLDPQAVLFDFRRPVAIIPNLAIHMNRDVNDGVKLNRQVDMLPLIGLTSGKFEKRGFFLQLLAREMKVKPDRILDYDMFLYEPEAGSFVGFEGELISAPRLDNLASTHAGLEALKATDAGKAVNVLAAFDNEEVGSSTRQGAGSPMLATLLERVVIGLGGSREDFFRAKARSILVSADAAHAVHPSKGEKCDPTNRVLLNRGPAIKVAASQSYTTDAPTAAMFESLCRAAKVPVQRFLNRSDERGGSTIGPISSANLDTRAVDVGMPLLSMHSIRELAGANDPGYFMKALREFYRV